jgi:hypothetical protein
MLIINRGMQEKEKKEKRVECMEDEEKMKEE